MEQTKITLVRTIQFNSSIPASKSKHDVDEIAEAFKEGVRSGGDICFDAEILIPQIATLTNTSFCNIVEVSYEVKVKAVVAGCHRDVKVKIPIVIGTIPLNLNNATALSNGGDFDTTGEFFDCRKLQ